VISTPKSRVRSVKFAGLALAASNVFTLTAALAATQQFEGTGVIAGASIDPPDPIEGCNRAKQDAEDKAAKAGTKGRASWERLSVDSDCKLSTTKVGRIGTYFIFTARGNFTI